MNIFDNFRCVVEKRRNHMPNLSRKIDDKVIEELLGLANWAPTHFRTEPWRFIVFRGEMVSQFNKDHADIYKANTAIEEYRQDVYDFFASFGENVSHVIVAYTHLSDDINISEVEEIASASIAVQHILLGAASLGISSFWFSGGMMAHRSMSNYLSLGDYDIMLGAISLGFSDKTPPGHRKTGIESKVIWKG